MQKKLLPLAILAGFALLAVLVAINPSQPEVGKPQAQFKIAVETVTVLPQDYPVFLQSYGNVQPRTQSVLVPQVSGQITWVSPNFRNGRFFEAGERLLQIDTRDYEANVLTAESALIDAQQALVQEQVLVDQATADWKRLGNSGETPALVRRDPQKKAAKARVLSAEAALAVARSNLERTRIVAPYAGRILSKSVDLGQVVSASTALAEVYATDYVEIRLPLKSRDLAYIDLPESFRYRETAAADFPEVEIVSELIGHEAWLGRLTRTEGAIDSASQQLYVVAQIDDPYGSSAEDKQPLKIGQYVSAEIVGRVVGGALVIPNSAIYQGSYVYLAENERVRRQNVEVAWQNNVESMISAGLKAGDQLVTTPLGQVASGTAVRIVDSPDSPLGKDLTIDRSAGNKKPASGEG